VEGGGLLKENVPPILLKKLSIMGGMAERKRGRKRRKRRRIKRGKRGYYAN